MFEKIDRQTAFVIGLFVSAIFCIVVFNIDDWVGRNDQPEQNPTWWIESVPDITESGAEVIGARMFVKFDRPDGATMTQMFDIRIEGRKVFCTDWNKGFLIAALGQNMTLPENYQLHFEE